MSSIKLFVLCALLLGAPAAWAEGTLTDAGGGGTSGMPPVGNEGDCALTQSGDWVAGACPGAGTGAPTDAKYIVQTANGTLSAEQALGALGTGLVLNATTTGVLSIYAGVTCTNQVLRILTASGAGTCNTITSAFVDTTVWTGTASSGLLKASSQGVLTAATPGTDYLTGPLNLATSVTGVTGIANGGTGLSTLAINQLLVGTNTDVLTAKTLPSCSAGTTSKLLYNSSTQEFSCGSDQGGEGSGTSAGGAGAVQTSDGAAGFVDSGCTASGGGMACPTFTGAVTGNAATATALAANGSNCSPGQAPLGVSASGAAESCTDYTEEPSGTGVVVKSAANTAVNRTITGTANEITMTNGDGVSGNPTIALASALNLSSKTVRIPNSATLPATCSVGEVYQDTSATTGQQFYACEATDTWALQGAPAEAPTLDTVFDQGKVIDGATSLANAVRIGGATTAEQWCAYHDSVAGLMFRPCTDANVKTIVPTNFTWARHDEEGACDDETVDPDAASPKAAHTFGCTATKPLKSIWFGAGSLSTDGTACAAPAEVTINSGPKIWTIICTDSDSSTIYGSVKMPDAWDGGTVTFEHVYIQTAANTGVLNGDIAAQCRGNGEVPSSTWGTEVAIDDAAVVGSNSNDMTTSAAVTPAGTCAAGDMLYFRYQIDATGTTTTAASLNTVGFKMEYTVTSRSD